MTKPVWRFQDQIEQGLVSVIMPIHNRRSLVSASLTSVLGQTYGQWEIIAIDDGSEDGVYEFLLSYAEAYAPGCLHVLRQERMGPSAARNRGLSVAKGEFVQFLDSDDLISRDKLANQIEALRAAPDCDFVYCPTVETESFSSGGCERPLAATATLCDYLRGACWFHLQAALFRRASLMRVGFYRDDLWWGEDAEYIARALGLGLRSRLEPRSRAVRLLHSGGHGLRCYEAGHAENYLASRWAIWEICRQNAAAPAACCDALALTCSHLARGLACRGHQSEARKALRAARAMAGSWQVKARFCLELVALWLFGPAIYAWRQRRLKA